MNEKFYKALQLESPKRTIGDLVREKLGNKLQQKTEPMLGNPQKISLESSSYETVMNHIHVTLEHSFSCGMISTKLYEKDLEKLVMLLQQSLIDLRENDRTLKSEPFTEEEWKLVSEIRGGRIEALEKQTKMELVKRVRCRLGCDIKTALMYVNKYAPELV